MRSPLRLLAITAALLLPIGCDEDALTYEDGGGIRVTTILAPDQTQFTMVSPVFELRCGSLDCHGQPGRPLRIYSGLGLRLPNDAGNLPGVNATTPDEIAENYYSVIGLEPEEMSRVVAGEDPPTDLLILAKPLMLESHKGGPAIAPGDTADLCITSWLLGAGLDTASCTAAASGF
jgi:hypothetical protein